MQILAHRGYWSDSILPNCEEALFNALQAGYGFESDLRDFEGKLVISHDIADKECVLAEQIFQYMARYEDSRCFAINIKSDGLKDLLYKLLQKYNIANYFTFDMSMPQMLEYKDKGITYFTRQSEYEKTPILYEDATGVWIDAFKDYSWITENLISNHISNGKQICIVSPELHNKQHLQFWERLNSYNINFDYVMLCTDFPDEAQKFFKNKIGD